MALTLLAIFLILYLTFIFSSSLIPIYPVQDRATIFGVVFFWSATGSQSFDIITGAILFTISSFFLLSTYLYKIAPVSIGITSILLASYELAFQAEVKADFVYIFTLPTIISMKLASTKYCENSKFIIVDTVRQLKQFSHILIVVIVGIELLVTANWILYVFNTEGNFDASFLSKITYLYNNYFYLIGLLSPLTALAATSWFLFYPLLIPGRNTLYRLIRYKFIDSTLYNNNNYSESQNKPRLNFHTPSVSDVELQKNHSNSIYLEKINKKIKIKLPLRFRPNHLHLLYIALVLAILIPLYPYSLSISNLPEIENKESTQQFNFLGVDLPFYKNRLDELSGLQIEPFVNQLFLKIDGGSRAFPILTMYVFQSITGLSAEDTVKYFPSLLGPLLVISVFTLIRTAYPDLKLLAGISSLMTALSHQVVVGFYGGFHANWFALIILFIACIFLLKSLRSNRWIMYTAFFGVTNVILLFSHSYTWTFFLAATILFLVWSAIRKNNHRRLLAILIVVSTASVGVDILKSHYSGFTSFDKNLTLSQSSISADEFTKRYVNLNGTFRYYLGGFLGYPVLFMLALIWALIAKHDKDSDMLILSLMSVPVIPILFGDYSLQGRIFYDIPYQIPASVIIFKIYRLNNKFSKLTSIALILMQFNYAFYAMANMILRF